MCFDCFRLQSIYVVTIFDTATTQLWKIKKNVEYKTWRIFQSAFKIFNTILILLRFDHYFGSSLNAKIQSSILLVFALI